VCTTNIGRQDNAIEETNRVNEQHAFPNTHLAAQGTHLPPDPAQSEGWSRHPQLRALPCHGQKKPDTLPKSEGILKDKATADRPRH